MGEKVKNRKFGLEDPFFDTEPKFGTKKADEYILSLKKHVLRRERPRAKFGTKMVTLCIYKPDYNFDEHRTFLVHFSKRIVSP